MIPTNYLLLFTALAVAGGFLGGFLGNSYPCKISPAVPVSDMRKSYLEEAAITEAVKTAEPAVVSIVATSDLPLYKDHIMGFEDFYFENLFSDVSGRMVSSGSGVILSSDGLILTNYHVIDDPDTSHTVILNTGEMFTVDHIEPYPLHDLAFLRVTDNKGRRPSDLPFARLGNSDKLQVGQFIVVIGNAFSRYSNSVTAGIISALNRPIPADSIDGNGGLVNLIQTDAVIHPGNSGGPLINLNGEVVGITTAVARSVNGIGFAIPSNDFRDMFQKILKTN